MIVLTLILIAYFTIGVAFAVTSFIIKLDLPPASGSAYLISFIEKTFLWPRHVCILLFVLLFWPRS